LGADILSPSLFLCRWESEDVSITQSWQQLCLLGVQKPADDTSNDMGRFRLYLNKAPAVSEAAARLSLFIPR
jgi:hypothetical protein